MNTVTEIVNTFAGLWAGQMWTIIWQSSVLVGLVVIVTLLFRRLSAAVKFWLWMLVPLRLLVMPLITISLPLLPANAPPHIEHVETAPAIVETPAAEYSSSSIENFVFPKDNFNYAQIKTPPIEIQEQKAEPNIVLVKPNLLTFIMILWFAGVAFWTVRLLWSWRKIRHIVRNAVKSDQKSLIEQTSKAAAIVGLKKIPEILATRENISPFLFGIFRPVLIIPSGFVNNVNEEGLAAVFSHEFAHLRRKDTLVGWILAICEVFYFFHPVLHFAKRRILFERERACDDWVIASGNSHKKTYANALIAAAGICRNFSARLGPTGVVAESFGDLKKRIIAIGSNIKPKTRLSKTAFVLLILMGTFCVPGFVLTNRSIANVQSDTDLIGGVVTNREGNTIAGAKIYLYHIISNWDFGNRVEEEVTSANDGAFIFEKPLPYDDLDIYPNGRDKFVIIATHPDYALGWCNIVRDEEKASYDIVLTEPQSQTITVTDQDGNPLAGARVWAYDMGEAEGPEPLFRENLGIVTDIGIAGAITGKDGKAIINNLPKTRCGFRTNLDGYASGLAFSGQRKIKLSKGATIRGSVLNDEGQPVENAMVKFFTNWGMWQFFLTKTDSQGKFVMKDIPAQGWDMSPWGGQTTATGSYIITVEHNDYISSENQDVFMPGDVKENFIIDVYRGTLVKCNVVEKGTNKPLAGVRVQGSSESGRIDGRTDSEGLFSFRVLHGDVSLFSSRPPDGVYFLRDEGSSNSTFRFDAEGDEKTVTLETPRIAGVLTTVSGKVILPDGSPAANVGIYTTNSAAYEGGGWTGAGGAYTGTNPDGTFKLEKVPAGLKLFIYGNTKDFKYILAETINQLDDPTILSEPLVMKPGQTADVLFTDKQGNPLVNKSVKITPKMWGNDVPRAEEHNGRTDEQGHLKINGVIPGLEYFIMDARGSRSESGWWDKYFNEERILIPEDGQPVEIRTQGSAQDVMTHEISGVVKDKNGNPISMARIELLNKELAMLPNSIEISGRRVRVISENAYRETSTDGSFRLKELNPGTTGIAVRADNYQTKLLEDISTGTKDLKITLDEPMSYILKGEVVDSEGNPIKGAQVTLAQDTGKITFAKVQTNDLGLFEFSDILEPIAEQNSRILIAQKEGFGLVGKMLDSTGGETYVKFVMSPEETVTGRVVDDSGNPINGAKVSLWSFNSGTYLLGGGVYFSRWTEIAPEVKTDSEGQFVFKGLPVESNVNLRAYADGYAASEGLNVNIGKAEGYAMQMGNGGMMMTSGIGVEANGEIEFVLPKGVTLRGTVTYEDTGQPVKGLKLGTQSIKESAWSDGITDESGKFEMKGVAPYPCNLLAMFDDKDRRALPEWTAPAVVLNDLEPGKVKDNIKIVLVKGGIIRGKVTDASGNPLNGIDIAFYSAARPRSGAACQLVYTSADGTWAFRFPEGEVYVYIRTNIQGTGWSRQDYTLNIKDGQEITDIDFKLRSELPENSPYRK